VLEIGGYAAGFCGRLFAQNGHDVVRVETGSIPPGWVSSESMDLFLHAGKRRVTGVDGALLAELASAADVVIVEAAGADEIEGIGLDDWTSDVKVAITPFGRTGPKRNWRATPSVLLAMGGYTNIMGDPDRAPLTLPGHYTEFQTGQFAYVAANACRIAGASNDIDIGMFETIMALSQFTTVQWHCAGRIRSRHGSDFWWVVPTNLFRCKDGWCYLNIVPTFWDALTTFLGRPELVIDPRFENNDARMAHRDELHAIVNDVLGKLSKVEVRERATESRIPLGVVQTFDEVLGDEHLAEREFWQTVSSAEGDVLSPCLPFRFDREPRAALALEPTIKGGEHVW
jgi:crotonobetainyl-CoA:carnitine CoA-transferase CaiB-like acyl-CoA transferase